MTTLSGPVGMRNRVTNVRNAAEDQAKVIDLLSRIAWYNGGKDGKWPSPILPGPDGHAPPELISAIAEFQAFWKARRAFRKIDGVVDPDGRSLKQMDHLVYPEMPPPPPLPPKSSAPPPTLPRVDKTWQITNMWSASYGEVGTVGGISMEITQPDGKKFKMTGAGAGVGISVDPVAYIKALKGLGSLNPFADKAAATLLGAGESLLKGLGFGVGDYLQWMGVSLTSLTGGLIVPSPLNGVFGRSTQISRYMLGGGVPPPFAVLSVGGGAGFGAEGGIVLFDIYPKYEFLGNGNGTGQLFVDTSAIGYYGSAGMTLKAGVGATFMIYHNRGTEDVD